VGTPRRIGDKSGAIADAKRVAENCRGAWVFGLNTLSTKELSVHEQPIEEDIETSRWHARMISWGDFASLFDIKAALH
jgi:hypothetical protein